MPGVGITLRIRPDTRDYCASSWHTKGAGTKKVGIMEAPGCEVWPRGTFIEPGN